MTTREQRRRRSLLQHGVALAVVAAVLVVGGAFRLTANEDRATGEAAVARLDAVFADAVAVGGLAAGEAPTQVAPGVLAATVSRYSADVTVLVTSAGRHCYALWWDADLVRRGRIMADDLPCEPGPVATSQRPIHFERAGVAFADPGADYPWEAVLPDAQRLRYFVLPGAILGGGAVLSVLVRMSLVLLTGEPRPR